MEIEKTAEVLGEDYVEMILSDMTEEELYPGWNDSIYMFSRNDSIEMDWDGRRNPNDEIIWINSWLLPPKRGII